MKYRYQNQNFKHKLDSARHYKRHLKKIPASPREIFLSKIGLGSWPSKIALLLAVSFLAYISFVPNFLFIKQIQINGLKLEERQAAEKQISQYFKKASFVPKKNYLFFRADSLKTDLEKSSVNILSVASIKKIFPNKISVEIKPRYAKYYAENAVNLYEISGDGVVVSVKPAGTEKNSLLTNIKFSQFGDWVVGQKIISDSASNYINGLISVLPAQTGIKVSAFKINTNEQLDLELETQSGYLIKLDLKTEVADNVRNLKGLFSQISGGAKLAYVDLRVPERVYVCYKNTACAAENKTVLGSATTTVQTLKPNK